MGLLASAFAHMAWETQHHILRIKFEIFNESPYPAFRPRSGWWQIAEKLFRWDDALTNRPNATYDSACPRSGEFSEQAKWEKKQRQMGDLPFLKLPRQVHFTRRPLLTFSISIFRLHLPPSPLPHLLTGDLFWLVNLCLRNRLLSIYLRVMAHDISGTRSVVVCRAHVNRAEGLGGQYISLRQFARVLHPPERAQRLIQLYNVQKLDAERRTLFLFQRIYAGMVLAVLTCLA
jgi:hypothetical protein